MLNSKNIHFTIYPLSFLTLLFISCSKFKNTEVGDGSKGIVEINLSESSFDGEHMLGNSDATTDSRPLSNQSQTRRNTIDVGNGFLLIAELTPEDPTLSKAIDNSNASLRDGSKAELETTNLIRGVRYRLQVYNSAGTWVAERDYVRGREASTPVLQLDGGLTYTFVVFSINSATDALPPVSPTATASRTLANSTINLTGTQDYMYFRQTLTVTGNSINTLNIVLKHRFSQITTTINSVQTDYNISAVSSNFQPHNTSATANLSNGNFTRSTATASSPVIFSSLGSTVITSNPTMINSPPDQDVSYQIPSITIGPLIQTNLTPLSTLRVAPGVRYNLTLNIVPADEYIVHSGLPAARINGVIWARHNLGVDPTINPDPAIMTIEQHGYYYQWGRLVRSAQRSSNLANPFIATNEPANNSWNSGTEQDPRKTPLDPCPDGYRIPTSVEFQTLIDNTVGSNLGPFDSGNQNFNSARILTSIRNRSVRLTLPAQGRMNVQGTAPPFQSVGIVNRGSTGYYHSSFSTNTIRTRFLGFTQGVNSTAVQTFGANRASKSVSNTIRCVGY